MIWMRALHTKVGEHSKGRICPRASPGDAAPNLDDVSNYACRKLAGNKGFLQKKHVVQVVNLHLFKIYCR